MTITCLSSCGGNTAPSESTTITVSWPPSLNRLWRHGRGRVYRSRLYQRWIAKAGWELKVQRPKPVAGPFKAHIILRPPNKRHRDADNLLKAVMDLLQSQRIIDNDSLCRQYVVDWDYSGTLPAVATVCLTSSPSS